MNATLNLDDDVLTKLQVVMKQSGRSLAEVVNLLLRGSFEIRESASPPAKRKPFVVDARPMGVRQGLDYSKVGKVLEQIEGPEHR